MPSISVRSARQPRVIGWSFSVAALVGCSLAACAPGESQSPAIGAGAATSTGGGQPDAGSGAAGGGQGGDDGGFIANQGPCAGHAGSVVCLQKLAVTCSPEGQPVGEKDCGADACLTGTGCVLCIAGQFSCDGKSVLSCNPGPPPVWEPKATCNAASEVCSSSQGVCLPLKVTGGTKPTGKYFQYARFTAQNSPFKAGCDSESYDNYIYVNRDGERLDVYTVELLDSDGDGKLEPNQHPDNPEAPGPIEQRVLTYIKTYDIPELGPVNASELYAASDRIYFLNWDVPGAIFEHVFATGVTTKIIDAPPPGDRFPVMGFDPVEGRWYTGVHYERTVFSYHAPSKTWVAEFKYPDLAGDHMDGMEVITDPNTGTSYVYVSDMTSDFLGQYRRAQGGNWVQVNLFEYAGASGEMVEGMGFGPFNHFWASGYPEHSLFEIGGGDLAKYTEPSKPPR